MILAGLVRLGREGSLRYMSDGTPVLNLAMAYNWGQKDAGGKRPTQWIDAALFGKRAEALAPHLTKGAALDVVLDDVRLEEWTRQDGTPGKPKLVGRVAMLEFAGRAHERASEADPKQSAPGPAAGSAAGFDGADDDLPF